MSNTMSEEVVVWQTQEGFFSEFPVPNIILQNNEVIDKTFTNLPLSCTVNAGKRFALMSSKNIFLNGMPSFGSVKAKRFNFEETQENCNLPFRLLPPYPPTTLHTNIDMLDGYPSTIYFNKNFINDPEILKYNDKNYITPKVAKLMIYQYLKEKSQQKIRSFAPQCINPEVKTENCRILVKWTDPVESDLWEGTVVTVRTDRFATSRYEEGNVTITSTSRTSNNANTFKDEWAVKSGLENGKKYYLTIATYNKNGDMFFNEENRFICVPELTYSKIYDENGNLIGYAPIN